MRKVKNSNFCYLNVLIDKDLKRRLRVYAAEHDVTATQIVVDELTRFLDAKEKKDDYERGIK